MHSNISITDGIYGELTHEDVIEGIRNLGRVNLNTMPPNTKKTV
jgi:hypothetical protein